MNDYELEFILTTSSDLKEDTLFAIVCPTCDSKGDFSSDLDRFHRLENVVDIDPGPKRGFRPREATIKDIENRQAKLRIAGENNELLKEISGLLKEVLNATRDERLVIAVSDDKLRFRIKRENKEE